MYLAALTKRRTTGSTPYPQGGNQPKLKPHPKALTTPRPLALQAADNRVTRSTTEAEMPDGIATPQGHLKYGQIFGKP